MVLRIRTWVISLLVAVMLAGIAARFCALGAKYYWIDEVYTSLVVGGRTRADVSHDLAEHPDVRLNLAYVRELLAPRPGSGLGDVVHTLREHDPHHGPLYFVGAHLWGEVRGTGPRELREFSAWLSLLLFPALWFLLAEIPELGTETRWAVLALFSASPFFLIYAQQAREYGLWAAALAWVLQAWLAAGQKPSPRRWAVFAISLGIALYADVLTAVAWTGLAVSGFWGGARAPARHRGFWVASVAAFACGSPWLLNIIRQRELVQAANRWAGHPVDAFEYAKLGFFSVTRLFYDRGLEPALPHLVPTAALLLTFGAGTGLAFLGLRRLPRFVRIALVGFALPLPLLFAGFDLVEHGRRAMVARYLMPTWMVLLLGVAIGAATSRRAMGTFAALLALSLLSSVQYLDAPYWWTSHPTDLARATTELAQQGSRRPVVATPGGDPVHLLSIAQTLDAATPFYYIPGGAAAIRARLWHEPFLLVSPSVELREALRADYRVTMVREDNLWSVDARDAH